jgi:hypothetical protein
MPPNRVQAVRRRRQRLLLLEGEHREFSMDGLETFVGGLDHRGRLSLVQAPLRQWKRCPFRRLLRRTRRSGRDVSAG